MISEHNNLDYSNRVVPYLVGIKRALFFKGVANKSNQKKEKNNVKR